jgi:hypothetical protein
MVKTIADLDANYHDAKSYCNLVKQWADITPGEMKPLLPTP